MCLSVFIPLPTPFPAVLGFRVGSGWGGGGQAGLRLSSSFVVLLGTVGPAVGQVHSLFHRHCGSMLAEDCWKVHFLQRTPQVPPGPELVARSGLSCPMRTGGQR